MLVEKFAFVDLKPDNVTIHEIGTIFEELLQRFSEMYNETAGEHYTLRARNLLLKLLRFCSE
jgi:type I restriction enzyme M protein